MAIVLITAPAEEPITLAQAKEHLRATDSTSEDALIATLIRAARQRVENYTWRRLITQTVDYTLDEFCSSDEVIELPCAPVQSVTHVKYYDTAGVEQTLLSTLYQVDSKSEPARIAPAYAQTWPTIREQLNAVTIRVVCGYGLAAAVPSVIKAAMLLIIGHLYEHREEVGDFETFEVPNAADALLFPYRILRF
jgi:uncharacterized phiE125 gp8 family phage protein